MDGLNLEVWEIDGSVAIRNSHIESLNLRGIKLNGILDLTQSHVWGDVDATGARIQQDFRTSETVFEGDLILRHANIGDSMTLSNTRVLGSFLATNIKVAENVFFGGSNSDFSETRLQHATIGGNLDFSHLVFNDSLIVSQSRIGGNVGFHASRLQAVSFSGSNVGGQFSLGWRPQEELDAVVIFEGNLNLESMILQGNILLHAGSQFQEVILDYARIGGFVEVKGSVLKALSLKGTQVGSFLRLSETKILNTMRASGLIVGQSLVFKQVEVGGDLDLISANISDDINTEETTFKGEFRAERAKIGGSIFFRNKSQFQGVYLKGLHVDHDLEFIKSDFNGPLVAESMHIGKQAMLRSYFRGSVAITFSDIGGALSLNQGKFDRKVSLYQTSMKELILWVTDDAFAPDQKHLSCPRWGQNSRLDLRLAETKTVKMSLGLDEGICNSWLKSPGRFHPGNEVLSVDLYGLRYEYLLGPGEGELDFRAYTDPDILVDWIENGSGRSAGEYQPQLYRALEQALHNVGAEEAARSVAYERRHRRAVTRDSGDLSWYATAFYKVYDSLLRMTVGYGVYPIWALGWFGGVVLIGWLGACLSLELPTEKRQKRFQLLGLEKAPELGNWRIAARLRNALSKWRSAQKTDCLFFSIENSLPLIPMSKRYEDVLPKTAGWHIMFVVQKILGFALVSIVLGALVFDA
jgi:hypothetical protein